MKKGKKKIPKTCRLLFFLSFFFLIISYSCSKEGPTGPTGERGIQGEQGLPGEQGPEGKPGNANVISTGWFSLDGSGWEEGVGENEFYYYRTWYSWNLFNKNPAQHGDRFRVHFPDGVVLVYVDFGKGAFLCPTVEGPIELGGMLLYEVEYWSGYTQQDSDANWIYIGCGVLDEWSDSFGPFVEYMTQTHLPKVKWNIVQIEPGTYIGKENRERFNDFDNLRKLYNLIEE